MGSLSGEATWRPSEVCESVNSLSLQTMTTAIGPMTHLGLTEHHSTHCATEDGMALVNGEGKLIAANGDEVWLTYTGELIAPPPVIVMLADYVVVGGTGRFENASGNIMALVYITFEGFDDPAWPLDMEFAGTINY
jgi:hypothetical protein